jgi:hypothetical protein
VSGDGFIDVYVGDRRISGVIFANGVALGLFSWQESEDRAAVAERLLAVVRTRIIPLAGTPDDVEIFVDLTPR